jgi:glycosyltransferase involved in cell wall biosynthesis
MSVNKQQDDLKPKKRILVLSSQAFSLLHFRLDMMLRFVELGYEVYAAAPDSEEEWSKQLSLHGIHYDSFELQRNGENPIKDIQGYFSVKKLIKAIKPDVVFAYQAKTVIYGTLAAHACGVTEIYDLIAGLGSVFRNAEKSWKRKLVKGILSLEYRTALKHAKVVFFQNHDDSKLFIDSSLVETGKIKYMNGSGVNTEHFIRQPMPQMQGKKVLFVGRYIADKGLHEYLEAARLVKTKHPDVTFEMVGYYDTNPSAVKPDFVQQYIDDGSVIDCGKQDDTYPYLKNCYTFVLPSYHEGIPKSVLEAMAVGRPIVTTNAPGCKETVENGVNGYLVDVGNSTQLADQIERIICNEKIAALMAEESYKRVMEKYDVRIVNEQLIMDMGLV